MANVWNSSYSSEPTGGQSVAVTDDELRTLKKNLEYVLGKEHNFEVASTPLDSSTNSIGRSLRGNGKTYVQGNKPTTRPDGSQFDAGDSVKNDEGRLWYKTDSNYQADGVNDATKIFGDQHFGLYVLRRIDGQYWWIPTDSECRGATKTWLGEFTNPTPGQWYSTGTIPGWFVLKNATYDVSDVPGLGTITVPALPEDSVLGLFSAANPNTIPSKLSSQLHGTGGTVSGGTVSGSGANSVTLDTTNVPNHWHNVTDNTVAGIRTNTPLSGGDGNGGGSFGVAFNANDFKSTADGGNDANKHTHHPINPNVSGQVQVNTLPSVGYPGVTAVDSTALSINDNPMWHIHSLTTGGQNPRTEFTQRSASVDNEPLAPVQFTPKQLRFNLLVRLY